MVKGVAPFGAPSGATPLMGEGRFGIPPGAAPLTERLLRDLASYWDSQQRVMFMGYKEDQEAGEDVLLRFMASRATKYVQVHVQSDVSGGGGAAYDPDTFVSSTQVDCRVNRLQEVTITRNGINQYWVYLIPKFDNGLG